MAIEPSSYCKDWNQVCFQRKLVGHCQNTFETFRNLTTCFRSWSFTKTVGAVKVLAIQPKLSKIWKQQQMEQKFPGEVLETVEFAKCEPFKRKFLKFRDKG